MPETKTTPRRDPTPNQGKRIFAYPDQSHGQPWLAIVTHEHETEDGYLECVAFPPGQGAVPLALHADQYLYAE